MATAQASVAGETASVLTIKHLNTLFNYGASRGFHIAQVFLQMDYKSFPFAVTVSTKCNAMPADAI